MQNCEIRIPERPVEGCGLRSSLWKEPVRGVDAGRRNILRALSLGFIPAVVESFRFASLGAEGNGDRPVPAFADAVSSQCNLRYDRPEVTPMFVAVI